MNMSWHVFVNMGLISSALLIATLIRARVKFFQKYLIPNALTAGFLMLPLYNYIFPKLGLSSIHLGHITYHFLGLSFIAMTLRFSPKKKGKNPNVFPTALMITGNLAFQAFLGMGLALILMATLMPDLFPTFGFLLPLGFSEGPGQAYSIGSSWTSYGISQAGSIGLTFAAIGFLFCCFGGIFLINHALRKGWVSEKELVNIRKDETRTGIRPKDSDPLTGAVLKTDTEAVDSFSLHIALVLSTYLASWLLLKGIGWLLAFAGPMGLELATNLWGINFIFAAFMGLLMRWILNITGVGHITDNQTLNRISGVSVDIMVTSAIAAISLVTVKAFWAPILLLSVTGGLMTFYGTIWLCSRLFTDHRFLRTLLIYGCETGTLSTGLALLRAVDPEFETPVAMDYTYASGLTFVLVIPLILIINLPLQSWKTGDPKYTWITMGVIAAYLLFFAISYILIARKRAFSQKRLFFKPQK